MMRLGARSRALLNGLSKRRRILFLLDFDGTLCELKSRPNLARLTPERRRVLARLRDGSWRVAVLSGRALPDLRRRVAVRGFFYGGNFGIEMRGEGWRFLHPRVSAFRGALAVVHRRLLACFRDIPGVIVERKGWGAALHYRNVPADRLPEFRSRLARFRRSGGGAGLEWLRTERAWEIVPDIAWGKGPAGLLLWRRLGRPYLIAIGDNSSDEQMFRAVRGRGLSVRVGRSRRSRAAYWLEDVAEVYRFLEHLAELRGTYPTPLSELRGIARGIKRSGLREKKERRV